MKEYFLQNFLFSNMEVDENEFPKVKIQHKRLPKSIYMYQDHFRSHSENIQTNLGVNMTYLMAINNPSKWAEFESLVSRSYAVYIIDDIDLQNEELKPIKEFYLKAYSYKIKKKNPFCFISNKKINN